MIASILVTLILTGFLFNLSASKQDEISYLLNYGQKVLIEGTKRGERKWDYACRLSYKSSYVAIVQTDTANYRLIPVPGGVRVEKICPSDIFKDAIRWYKNLKKSSY
ncbi:MAG: hypothetical protein HQ517_00020 [SAR324 cluster bacterium]|nr:hypothetical protein [SAR324 cluster bacterium]